MTADVPSTIRSLLSVTAPWLTSRGSSSGRLDAELLLGHALGMKRLDLYLDLDRPLSADELTTCRALVKRRGQGEPVAYILGYREFYGLRFVVSPAVLIPRPDTERLVELALSMIPDDAEGTVVDVCTGSGCVAIAILAQREGLRAVATDVSAAALAIAAHNAEALGVADRISFREGDLMAPCADVTDALLVVANPPYVLPGSPLLEAAVAAHEPALALYGEGADALGHHRRIATSALSALADDGAVLLEIGADQGRAALALQALGYGAARIEQDLDGHDRVLVLQR
jgi:release factor glutamine methyltransferase